ncbi:MAG TPA: YceI family protein [Actinomycetota bacterium]
MTPPVRARRWRWAALGVGAAVLVAVGGPYAYTHLVGGDAPAPLGATATSPTTRPAGSAPAADQSVNGTWKVTSGSQAGYRVKEVLFGQRQEAVGRTSAVTGQMVVQGSQVTSGRFSVDLTTVQSDQSRRDAQFQGRIMDTASYPTATFELARPIGLPSLPGDGGTVGAKAQGRLTLHGTTREVTVDVTAGRSGDRFRLSGQVPSPSPTGTSPTRASAAWSPPRTTARSSSCW